MLRQKVIKIYSVKSCQILCAHKHCFLMSGHNYGVAYCRADLNFTGYWGLSTVVIKIGH